MKTRYVTIGGVKYKIIYDDNGKASGVRAVTASGSTRSLTSAEQAALNKYLNRDNGNPPGTKAPPSPAGPSSGGARGGGAAGITFEDFSKNMKRVYFQIGLKPDEVIIKNAWKNKDLLTSGGAMLAYIRRNDKDYIYSEPGRNAARGMLQILNEMFPNKKFRIESVRSAIAKGWNATTFQQWLTRPGKGGLSNQQKLFARYYPYWNQYRRFNPEGGYKQYREYSFETNRLYQQYYQRKATKQELKTFYHNNMDPGELAKRFGLLSQSKPSLEWMAGGQKMPQREQNQYLLNGTLSQVILGRLQKAFQTQRGYIAAKPVQFAAPKETESPFGLNI